MFFARNALPGAATLTFNTSSANLGEKFESLENSLIHPPDFAIFGAVQVSRSCKAHKVSPHDSGRKKNDLVHSTPWLIRR